MNYNWKNKKILVAEDSEMNFILLKKSLETSGAEILWAKDGEELIKSVENQKDISNIYSDNNNPQATVPRSSALPENSEAPIEPNLPETCTQALAAFEVMELNGFGECGGCHRDGGLAGFTDFVLPGSS